MQVAKHLDFVGLLFCCPRKDLGREVAGWLRLVEGLDGENGGVRCYSFRDYRGAI